MIRRRRMVRHFTDRPLAPEMVGKVLRSALRAPSAGFSQGWAFLSLTASADRARFWPVAAPWVTENWQSVAQAPLIVVPLSHKKAYLERYAEDDKGWEDRAEARWPVPYWHIDTGMAALLMLLTAVDEGLGGFFFGIAPEYLGGFRAEFAVPEEYTPIGAVVVGYRAEEQPVEGSAATRKRRGTDEVVHHGQWGRLTP
ncbi:nitroreductase family protein [Kibdelosporangium persicum]|uniref:Nitroreductase n=1 Tax=Kibdelosporangium persicum TaxID=2698649 RepID=A0ABX2EYK8_9PSEU|nr:Nitroreductase [Kibdelosporangium persicum]